MPKSQKVTPKQTAKRAVKQPVNLLVDLKLTEHTKGLTPTGVTGVYTNRVGSLVDARGVLMTFKNLRARDNAHFKAASEDSVIGQPADLLRAVALDPTQPLAVRVDAAHKAAAYYTPKLIAVQGVAGAPPIGVRNMADLSQEELDKYEALTAQAAQLVGVV
jgi:hypothetical protein